MKNIKTLLLVFAISLLTILPLLENAYFPMHDDLQVMRLFQMEKCFADGQVPCRWSPDMVYGYGQAMFNYYSATPYYLGIVIRIIMPFLSLVGTAKALFGISLVASSIGMYLLGKSVFGKSGGLVAAVLYTFAPYKAVDVYVRGAMAEAFSLAIMPFVWLAIYKTIKKPTFLNVAFLAVAGALQLATHNISTLMYSIFTVAWALFWLSKKIDIKRIWALLCGALLGISLAGFFIIPVYLERSLIQDRFFTLEYLFFGGHFVTIRQLFLSRVWGYGPSIYLDQDDLSFQIGWPHWWVGVLLVFLVIALLLSKKYRKSILILMLLCMSGFAAFLTHSRSTFLWESISNLPFVQFPWRFLGVVIFTLSLSGGSIGWIKVKLLRRFSILAIVVLSIFFNFQYFRPMMPFYNTTDEIKLTGEPYFLQQKSATLDYLPTTAPWAPQRLAPNLPEIVSGEAEFQNYSKTSSTFFFDAIVHKEATVSIPVMYFPGWKVFLLDGQDTEISAKPAGEYGAIEVIIPEGKHMVQGRFTNTPVRTFGNSLTIISFLVIVSGVIITLNKRKFIGFS